MFATTVLRRGILSVALTGILGLAPTPASASHHRLKGEVESLSARLVTNDHGPAIEVYYKVEIEDYAHGDAFDVAFTLREHGRVVRDAKGVPLQIVVRLSDPYKWSDDEMKFKRTIVFPIADRSFDDPYELRITATVHLVGDAHGLDHKDAKVKVAYSVGRRNFLLTCGAGY